MTDLKAKPERKPGRKPGEIICDPLSLSSQFLCTARDLDPRTHTFHVANEIDRQVREIRSGNLESLEERLLSQVMVLESFGSDCLIKAQGILGSEALIKHSDLLQTLAHLALRSQNQARQSIETLRELRTPKRSTTFIKNNIEHQLNQVLVENAELKRQLGVSTNAQVDTRSPEATEPTYEAAEGVAIFDGTTL